jgi:hypothetical protein
LPIYLFIGSNFLIQNRAGEAFVTTKKAKGKRPVYFDNPETDKLLAMVLALAGEVSVLRERLDTIERLASSKSLISLEEIETYKPDEQVLNEREQWRQVYLDRILRIIKEDLELEINNS